MINIIYLSHNRYCCAGSNTKRSVGYWSWSQVCALLLVLRFAIRSLSPPHFPDHRPRGGLQAPRVPSPCIGGHIPPNPPTQTYVLRKSPPPPPWGVFPPCPLPPFPHTQNPSRCAHCRCAPPSFPATASSLRPFGSLWLIDCVSGLLFPIESLAAARSCLQRIGLVGRRGRWGLPPLRSESPQRSPAPSFPSVHLAPAKSIFCPVSRCTILNYPKKP